MILLNALLFALGLAVVFATLTSAIRTFVLPRSAPDRLTRFVFVNIRRLFDLSIRKNADYERMDRIMAFYAPVSLLTLLPMWLLLVTVGYSGMFRATGIEGWVQAFTVSGSSLLTLGFAQGNNLFHTVLAFSEATIGLILVALLIAYLPAMYSAFSRRELAVTQLEARAGNPPSAVEMLKRFYRIRGLEHLSETWATWETWFSEIEESHTSLAALVFFRSPDPTHSWVTAAGAVLDAAALTWSVLDVPRQAQAALCIRSGYLALRRISDFFGVTYNADASFPADPISITRAEFDAACDELAAQGLPLIEDREQAWQDFAGWRVNYDAVLLALSDLTMAPEAPWSSDRT